jgi:hypothetical protein
MFVPGEKGRRAHQTSRMGEGFGYALSTPFELFRHVSVRKAPVNPGREEVPACRQIR